MLAADLRRATACWRMQIQEVLAPQTSHGHLPASSGESAPVTAEFAGAG